MLNAFYSNIKNGACRTFLIIFSGESRASRNICVEYSGFSVVPRMAMTVESERSLPRMIWLISGILSMMPLASFSIFSSRSMFIFLLFRSIVPRPPISALVPIISIAKNSITSPFLVSKILPFLTVKPLSLKSGVLKLRSDGTEFKKLKSL